MDGCKSRWGVQARRQKGWDVACSMGLDFIELKFSWNLGVKQSIGTVA